MRGKATTTNHGIAIGIGLGSGGGGLLFWAIFLMTACPILMSVSVHGLCIPSERKALMSFKRGLTDPSDRLSSWRWVEYEHPHGHGHGVDCCHWRGVVCHNSTGHVLQLRLGCKGSTCWETKAVLGGKLSPSLLDLKHLTHLDLSFNDFEGIPIPRFLGSLQSLTYLNLSDGRFGGMIPQQLGDLSNLHSLDLSESFQLRSDSLGWVRGLSKLQYLDLSYVNLSEARDWLQATNTLPSLKQLRLSSCQISGITIPTSFLAHNFSHLSVLDLSHNSLSDPIPVGLANLTRLTTLHLSSNTFNSSIPEWLFHLKKLQVLHLRRNSLEGVIPEGIGNMTALSGLDLSYNSLSGPIPVDLGNLTRLTTLDLFDNRLSGPIPVGLANLTRLTTLDLFDNRFNSSIPEWLFHLNKLQVLDLRWNSLEGVIPEGIANMSGLSGLDLSFNSLSGPIPVGLVNLTRLTTLDISLNSLHGPIPESIGRLSSLEFLYVDHNQLNGTLPESLGQLTRLRELYILDNQLMGDVTQAHFSNLTELTYLSASRNKLSLKVGPKWVPSFQLKYLDLDFCQVGPLFPQWLRSQKQLLSLQLSGVGISSTIPDWFPKSSPHCSRYNLSHNHIYGDISKFVQSILKADTIIDFCSNQLQGPLPPISPLVGALDLSNNSFLVLFPTSCATNQVS